MIRWTVAAASCLALAILTLNADPGWPFHGAEASGVQAPAGSACPANAKPANLNFTLKDIDNKDVKLASLKGKVILLDFWATWCGPCKQEIPGYIALQKKYGADKLAIVGMSVDQAGPDVVKAFIEKNQLNYQIVMADEAVQTAFGGFEAIPTTFLIDQTGQIRDRKMGSEETEEYEKKIAAILN
jgi:thiol-disulfide isomerase/thioredoxin